MLGTDRAVGTSVDVSLDVKEVTELNLSACPTAALQIETIGGVTGYSDDCELGFSTNSAQAHLRVRQSDGAGVGMFQWTTGTPDPAWKTGVNDGVVITDDTEHPDLTSGVEGQSGIAVTSDGSVLMSGNDPGDDAHHVLRYLPDGTLDTTYGNAGVASHVPVPGQTVHAHMLRVLPDDSVLAIGHSNDAATDYYTYIVKFDPDGQLDTTWNDDGVAIIDLYADQYQEPYGLEILPDGSMVLGGVRLWNRGWVAKLTQDGDLDPDFGTTGPGYTQLTAGDIDRYGGRLAIDGLTGEIYWIGERTASDEIIVAKFAADGTRITTGWGVSGYARYTFASTGTNKSTMGPGFVDSQGRLVMIGYSTDPAAGSFVTRFTTSGAVDFARTYQPFGVTRQATLDSGSIVLTGDDRFCAAGEGAPGGTWRQYVACFRADGTPDPNFGDGTYPGIQIVLGASDYTVDGGITSVDGALFVGAGASEISITKLGGDGASVPDYQHPTVDFDTAGGAFGACLKGVGGGAAANWIPAPGASCVGAGSHWNAIPTRADAGGVIATVNAAAGTATVDFGAQIDGGSGTYTAPMTFEVIPVP